MTQTTFYADHYEHRDDLAHYLRTARRYLDSIEELWLQDHENEAQAHHDSGYAIEQAQSLDFAAGQILNYVVGWARFEGNTWADVGQALDVTKQAASERFRHLATIPHRGQELGTLSEG